MFVHGAKAALPAFYTSFSRRLDKLRCNVAAWMDDGQFFR